MYWFWAKKYNNKSDDEIVQYAINNAETFNGQAIKDYYEELMGDNNDDDSVEYNLECNDIAEETNSSCTNEDC